MAEFEPIVYEIRGDAKKAADGLLSFEQALRKVGDAKIDGRQFSDFAAALKDIREATKGGGKSFTTLANGLSTLISSLKDADSASSSLGNLAGALGRLKDIGKISIPKGIGDGIKNIASATAELSSEALENLDRMTTYMQRLAGVDMRGFSSVWNRVGKQASSSSANVPLQSNALVPMGAPTDTALLDGLAEHLGESARTSATLGDKLKVVLQDLTQLGKKVVMKVDDSSVRKAAKSTSALSKMFDSLKRIALYRVIRSAIKAIGQAFQEGLQNAYLFSAGLTNAIDGRIAVALDGLTTKALTMKNQLGAAFGSLLTAIAPIINTLISLITSLATAITQLFAAFTGGTFLKAKDVSAKFADDMKRGGGSAKEWKNQLMGFDVINRLEEPSKGGGGSSATTPDPNDMFEVMEIDSRIASAVQKIKDFVNSIDFSPLSKAFDNLKTSVQRFVDVAMSGLSWVWDNVLTPLAHWTMEEAAPVVVNLLANSFDLLGVALEKVSPLFDWLYRNILKPFFGFIGDVALYTLEQFSNLLGDLADLLSGKISFKEFIKGASNMELAIGSVLTVLGVAGLIGTLKMLSDSVLVGVFLAIGGVNTALGFFAAHPAVLAVAAIAGIIFIGIELYKNWDKIIAKLGEFQQKLSAALGDGKLDFWDFASVAYQAIMAPIDAIMRLVGWVVELCRWIKTAWEWFNQLSFVKSANSRAQQSWDDGSIWNGMNFASGGYPQTGELFLAREAGPELVGTMGGHTAVANNDQIVSGISQGVYEAVLSAMGNSGGSNQPIIIMMDGKEIARTTTRYQNQMARANG